MARTQKYYAEGYGCSFNISETQQLKGFFEKNNFVEADAEEADFLVVNTCAVKDTTEKRMLHRIRKLFEKKKGGATLIAFGCLAATRKEKIRAISGEIEVLDTSLESLCRLLNQKARPFSPGASKAGEKSLVSIIPISVGCLGSCTYCATKLARGDLRSYSVCEINEAFRKAAERSREIWVTSQDLACYGLDSGSSLKELMATLLGNKARVFVRMGMMNPEKFLSQHEEILSIFEDKRVFRFLHLPLQSGSEKILRRMNRKYSPRDFLKCVSLAREKFPEMTIATDAIVGFPGEREEDFNRTIDVLKESRPDVVNIARYSKRPGTRAAEMPGQLTEGGKKARSRKLTEIRNAMFLENNKEKVGKEFDAIVDEKAKGGKFVARTSSYRPVIVGGGFGEFVRVRLERASTHCFQGRIVRKL